MTKIAILTIFRDESHIMYEWCKYHVDIGFDHVFMINNDSKDNYQEVINDLNSSNITVFHEPGKKIQTMALRKYYKLIKDKYEWVYITDLDEFIHFNNQELILKNFLDGHASHIHVINIEWKIFNPSQFVQPKSVIENNTICFRVNGNREKRLDGFGKSIVRTVVLPCKLHHHRPRISKYNIMTYHTTDKIVQINHYRYSSWEFMLGIKMSRGGGVSGYRRWSITSRYNKRKTGTNQLRLKCEDHENEIDTTLKDKCKGLIKDIHRKPQTKPMVSIYNNKYYNKVKDYLLQHPEVHPGDDKNSILKFNRDIIRVVES